MATGTVKWYDPSEGIGFITPDDGDEDVFFDKHAVNVDGNSFLTENERVLFLLSNGPKGLQASNIQRS